MKQEKMHKNRIQCVVGVVPPVLYRPATMFNNPVPRKKIAILERVHRLLQNVINHMDELNENISIANFELKDITDVKQTFQFIKILIHENFRCKIFRTDFKQMQSISVILHRIANGYNFRHYF